MRLWHGAAPTSIGALFGGQVTLKGENTIDAYWTDTEIDQFLRANYRDPLYPLYILTLNSACGEEN